MESQLKSAFKFWPVGQGGFYSGKIAYKNENQEFEFNTIFDCGSTSRLIYIDNEIDNYNEINVNQIIDIVFLSHLDKDHVNRITKLIGDKTCEKLVMPYYSEQERFYLAVFTESTNIVDRNYLEFIDNPHDYLFRNCPNIREIVYIKGNDSSVESLPIAITSPTNPVKNVVDKLTPLLPTELTPEMKKISENPKIVFRKGGKSIDLDLLWRFEIHHKEYDAGLLDKISTVISNLELEFTMNQNENFQTTRLTSLLNNSKIREFKNYFKEYHIDLNKSGIIVTHFPLVNVNTQFMLTNTNDLFVQIFYEEANFIETTNSKRICTLLTGDVGMRHINAFENIRNKLGHLKVFQVPHHGSQTDWESESLTEILKEDEVHAAVQYGNNNYYNHPREIVMRDLSNLNFTIHSVNQFESWEYFMGFNWNNNE